MLYHLFTYLNKFDFPGAGMFHYLSFRASFAFIAALLISIFFGKRVIQSLQKKQVGEIIRNLGLEGQMQKKGTPTMGGILIFISIIVPTLLFANLTNVYILLMLFTTIWFCLLGFLDDYIKVFKKNKEGLHGRYKIIGQVICGLAVGLTLYFHDDVEIAQKNHAMETVQQSYSTEQIEKTRVELYGEKSTKTTIPFVKNNEFDYKSLVSCVGAYVDVLGWILFVLVVIFITTAVSNGVNLTDGLDGLAAGTTAIVGAVLGILAYLSGNVIYSSYLNIMYIPYSGELVVYASAFLGATIGFLWYNSFPAQVFMGDTGSLMLGGIIGVFAILIRKELLLPILCGIFFAESVSVIIQVTYFKHTKKKFGEGKRFFLMAPLHHHYQKKGIPESKIVARFWLVALILGALALVTLKIR